MEMFAYFNSSIALVLVSALCFFYLLRKSRDPNCGILPPEAAGGWPIIGHFPLLSGGELPHIVLGALADKYGPIYRIRLGIQMTVVVSSSEIIKELFTTKDMAVASRPKLVASEIMGYNNAMFGLGHYGQYWREIRKMVTSELLTTRRIELQKNIRCQEVEALVKGLYNVWKNNKSGHVLVNMSKWFEELTMNVILRIVVGKRSFGAGAEGEEAKQCQRVTRDIMRLLGAFVMRDAVPFLGWLDLGGYEKAMKKTGKEWDDLLSQWLEEHKKKGVKEEKDFMDVMLSLLDGRNIGGFDPDVINKATVLTMIIGGSDTTSTTLTWAIALLLNNRDALKKVQTELDIKVGKQRLVQESDITSLVYLQAVVKETFRLNPPGPLSVREFTEDCSIGGYHVPKGARLLMNSWKIQTDPKVWNEPFRFRPERFFETHKDLDVKGHNYELIPFGGGRRACPGVSFSMQLVPFVLASFLHAFELSNPSDELVDMSGSVGMTNAKATPLEVIISPRLSLEIYESL